MKKKSIIVLFIFAIVILLGILGIFLVKYSMPFKTLFLNLTEEYLPKEVEYVLYYQNNELVENPDFQGNDVMEVRVGDGLKQVINHARGFSIGFPMDAEFDFSVAQDYIKAEGDNLTMYVSKEYTTYLEGDKTKGYIKEYVNKYLLADTYLENNRITIHKDAIEYINKNWVQIIALSRQPAPDSEIEYNTYVYCYIYTGTPKFYRVMFKAPEYNDEIIDKVYRTLYSFEDNIIVSGTPRNTTNFKPEIPDNWSEETRRFYDELVNSDGKIKWGIYEPLNVRCDDMSDILTLEEKLDYQFDGVLEYLYLGEDLPISGMNKAYKDNKVIELTIQTSTVMNENLDGYNPVFDVIDGKKDDEIYTLAKQIKEYGHPILFRLNNEMNSDWTSYGISATMNDPEIYIEIWRRIYNIFMEVGVDNTIWVFNPNNESFPPHGYNQTMAFYPGDEYVQVFGITGYNTGTYYAERNNEVWKEFDYIYSDIHKRNYETYKNFPWLITEFASSSVGGDKAEWIKNMFSDIKKYPNIKMAFWFNSADYDVKVSGEEVLARPYWLDENEETLKAFKEGLSEYK